MHIIIIFVYIMSSVFTGVLGINFMSLIFGKIENENGHNWEYKDEYII